MRALVAILLLAATTATAHAWTRTYVHPSVLELRQADLVLDGGGVNLDLPLGDLTNEDSYSSQWGDYLPNTRQSALYMDHSKNSEEHGFYSFIGYELGYLYDAFHYIFLEDVKTVNEEAVPVTLYAFAISGELPLNQSTCQVDGEDPLSLILQTNLDPDRKADLIRKVGVAEKAVDMQGGHWANNQDRYYVGGGGFALGGAVAALIAKANSEGKDSNSGVSINGDGNTVSQDSEDTQNEDSQNEDKSTTQQRQ